MEEAQVTYESLLEWVGTGVLPTLVVREEADSRGWVVEIDGKPEWVPVMDEAGWQAWLDERFGTVEQLQTTEG